MRLKNKIFMCIIASFLFTPLVANSATTRVSVAKAFYDLADNKNISKIEELLKKGYSLESVDERGYTPVCMSVSRQNRAAYDILLSRGADDEPSCLKAIPKSAYQRFFGDSMAAVDSVGESYTISAVTVGAGVAIAAYALRGSTGGGGSDDSSSGGGSDDNNSGGGTTTPDEDLDDDFVETCETTCTSSNMMCNEQDECVCIDGDENGNCYNIVSNCLEQSGGVCKTCVDGYSLDEISGKCYAVVENCETQIGAVCSECKDDFDLYNNTCIDVTEKNACNAVEDKVWSGDTCICKENGYIYEGDIANLCHMVVEGCSVYNSDGTCYKCTSGVDPKDNICYDKLPGCSVQDGDVCEICAGGYYLDDDKLCYLKIDNCADQTGNTCNSCNEEYGLYNNICYSLADKATCDSIADKYWTGTSCVCLGNKSDFGDINGLCYTVIDGCSSYDTQTGDCIACSSGVDPINNVCYNKIANCADQTGSVCNICEDDYYLDNNLCYLKIDNCANQTGNICNDCNSGYELYNNVCYDSLDKLACEESGDKTWSGTSCVCQESGYAYSGDYSNKCYPLIDGCILYDTEGNCSACSSGVSPVNNVCNDVISGCIEYNEYGCETCLSGMVLYDYMCYNKIENCQTQIADICEKCEEGYDTYGGSGAVCFAIDPCQGYSDEDGVVATDAGECVCDVSRGYTGEPGSCTFSEDGTYAEGDELLQEWNNNNEMYCNSHGSYEVGDNGEASCECYKGYEGDSCSSCSSGYVGTAGLCYTKQDCGANEIQSYDQCICADGYMSSPYNDTLGQCILIIECGLHETQISETECGCKSNFVVNSDGSCSDACEEGYDYNEGNDVCVKICTDNWAGTFCNYCPEKYQVTGDDNDRCYVCAENRTGEDCDDCASGYEWVEKYNACISTTCSGDHMTYNNTTYSCECDEGYRFSSSGNCELLGEDYIGTNENINNNTITMTNEELRDVYGMKPLVEDSDGNITYYSDVYNTYVSSGTQSSSINIYNSNSGSNYIYGIYAPSNIYNSAVLNASSQNAYASATINITDSNSASEIFGIYSYSDEELENISTAYNAFAYAVGNNVSSVYSNSVGEINITKDEDSSGAVIGMYGNNNLYNSYAATGTGSNVDVTSKGSINLINLGNSADLSAIGMQNLSASSIVINSYAYLNSSVSKATSVGSISITANDTAFGIYSQGTVANSMTQYNTSYNISPEFSSTGIIDITNLSGSGLTYGIYSQGDKYIKTSVYNAYGYNSTGEINITSNGGSVYGIYSASEKYYADESDTEYFYNNTYNAFRSAEKYSNDEDTATTGSINISIIDTGDLTSEVIGIYAAGNVYNSFAYSDASDVTLLSNGYINIDSENTKQTTLVGIKSSGATIANSYNEAADDLEEANTTSKTTAEINISTTKSQSSATEIYGIYSTGNSSDDVSVFNAALINSNGSSTGSISISSDSNTAAYKVYGIYDDNSLYSSLYNAYYSNKYNNDSGTVNGNISIDIGSRSEATNAYYVGMYVSNGSIYNAYTDGDVDSLAVSGSIYVSAYGGRSGGKVIGMQGVNAYINNSGNSIIYVTSLGSASAYGIEGTSSDIYNNAKITVTSENGSNAYGVYAYNSNVENDENGLITVSGDGKNYGIYASNLSTNDTATVINSGTITVSGGSENYGIYVDETNNNVIVENTGTINIDGTACTGGNCVSDDSESTNAAIMLNDATFNNSGVISSANSLDLDSWNGTVLLSSTGTFDVEESLSGDLGVSTSVVTDSFSTQETIKSSIKAEDVSDLNLSSASYLYTASLSSNNDGTYDVNMDMKDFSEVTDSNMSDYLLSNYENENNVDLFNALKEASTSSEYSGIETSVTGREFIPSITSENLKVMRSLDSTMMSDLFKGNDDIRQIVGYNGFYIGKDDSGSASGYDISSHSMYALYDKKLSNKYRLGAGFSFTTTNTDYNDDSSHDKFMVQGYIPFTYTNKNNLTGVSMLRLGYSDGDYSRVGYDDSYDADINEITYGLLNELRYKMRIGSFNFTPYIGLNAIGYYQSSIDEGNSSLSLNIDSANIFSLESALGLYIDKEIEFDSDNKLSIMFGGGYYHEFADPYESIDGWIEGTTGSYDLRTSGSQSRDRGILSAKVGYDYKSINIYGEIMQYLEDDHPIKLDLGLKYKF